MGPTGDVIVDFIVDVIGEFAGAEWRRTPPESRRHSRTGDTAQLCRQMSRSAKTPAEWAPHSAKAPAE